MLAFGAASSLLTAAHPPQSITCATSSPSSSAIHPVTVFPSSHQLSVSASYNSFRVKAMAETLSTPKIEPKPTLFGKRQALISLSDKKDLALLGAGLQELGFTIVSTGGTASALEGFGVTVTKVEELTQFPEMLDDRVKTLHPNVHGGILARRDQEHHMEALNNHGIGTFDVVVVNLYSFYYKVSSSTGISFEDGIENIDIGGRRSEQPQRIIRMFWLSLTLLIM